MAAAHHRPPFASVFLPCCVCVYLAFSSFAFFFEDPKSVLKMAESAPQSTFGARYIQIAWFGRNNLQNLFFVPSEAAVVSFQNAKTLLGIRYKAVP
jgi:hypothetical protein